MVSSGWPRTVPMMFAKLEENTWKQKKCMVISKAFLDSPTFSLSWSGFTTCIASGFLVMTSAVGPAIAYLVLGEVAAAMTLFMASAGPVIFLFS